MSNIALKCRRGSRIDSELQLIDVWPDGIPAEYTICLFEIREIGDETTDALLSADTSSGLTIDHDNAIIDIAIVPSQTSGLPITPRDRELFGQIRLTSSIDADLSYSWVIPRLVLRPNGIPL